MADSQTFWATDFWATGFWADDFWAGGAPVPVVTQEPAGGGRRIEQKRKTYRPLTKRERREFDSWFRSNKTDAVPVYVAPPEARPQPSRVPLAEVRPVQLPNLQFDATDRVHAAELFLALDAIEQRIEARAQRRAQARQAAALRRAVVTQREAEHAQRIAYAQLLAEQAEERRLAAEQDAIAFAVEQERLRLEAEDEMMQVLLLIHEGV